MALDSPTFFTEIPRREVEETELVPGVRYWATSRTGYNNSVSSGIYANKYYNTNNLPMLKFIEAYCIKGHIGSYYENSFSYRYWYPRESMLRYYEIRTMPKELMKEIKREARKKFEKRCSKTISDNTDFPEDISNYIASFINDCY